MCVREVGGPRLLPVHGPAAEKVPPEPLLELVLLPRHLQVVLLEQLATKGGGVREVRRSKQGAARSEATS